jgi:hypothetical protein
MTDPLNGTTPPDPLAAANARFAKAYALAIAPGGQLQFNPMNLLIELEMLKLTLGALIDSAVENGLSAPAFNHLVASRLNAQAEALEGPKIAVAPATAIRKR